MDISVYLPDQLKAQFDAYVKKKNTSRNTAIRKAVELLLRQEKKNKWGNWIDQLKPDPSFPKIEDLRADLKPPRENFFLMSFLLATCTVIDVLRGDNSSIIKLKSLSPIQVNISSITGFELVYGTEKASKRSIDVIKSMLVEINIINFGSKEAHEVASIRYNLRKSGSPIGLYDVPIGATAMINNLTLVTSKVNEFKRIPGLNIENWRASG